MTLYYSPLLNEAQSLVEKMDNPACVMIRRLTKEILELQKQNERWSEKYFKLVEEKNNER